MSSTGGSQYITHSQQIFEKNMSIFKKTFRSLIIGGLFFIIPLVVLIFLFKKAIALLLPIGKHMVGAIGLHSLFGVATVSIVSVILLLLICYLAGFLMSKGFITQWSNGVEEKLFMFFPGIQMLKYRMIGDQHNNLRHHWQAILLKEETCYRIGFITDNSDPGYFSIYLPDAPKMDAGEIRFIPKETCVYHPISISEAMKIIQHFGRGHSITDVLLKDSAQ